jgi:uncharacterized protein YoxC
MSSENIERQIEFILEHQAKFSEDLDRLKEVQSQQAANIDRLGASVQLLNETVSMMQSEMEANRVEMREAINNLIVSNEVTRDFANKIAQLAIATSQRVTNLESRE